MENWDRDHAASGYRSRAFLRNAEVIVYDTGEWEIRENGLATCSGKESDTDRGKLRALRVYEAMFS
jgi:hypothetical protein